MTAPEIASFFLVAFAAGLSIGLLVEFARGGRA